MEDGAHVGKLLNPRMQQLDSRNSNQCSTPVVAIPRRESWMPVSFSQSDAPAQDII